jgi:hypothetical protein
MRHMLAYLCRQSEYEPFTVQRGFPMQALLISTDFQPHLSLVRLHHINPTHAMVQAPDQEPCIVKALQVVYTWPSRPHPKIWNRVRALEKDLTPGLPMEATRAEVRAKLRKGGIR